ncbi:MAG: hypothetical protein ACK4KT_06685 [Thermaurantimonas sp.]
MTIKIGDSLLPYFEKSFAFIRRKEVNISIKYAVVIACMYILFRRLNESDFRPEIWVKNIRNLYTILPFVLLSFLNFFLDVYLWALISKGSHKLRLSHYAYHHLISMSLGFITPNNIGEYGGKMRQFDAPISRVKGFLLAFHFRTVKKVARNIIGLIATILLFTDHNIFFLKDWHIFLFTIVVITYFLIYWNIELFIPYISNISIQGKNYFQLFLRIKVSDINKLKWIGISALKFVIYTSQMTLLLMSLASEDLSFFEIWLFVAFYYSLASYLPTILAFDPIVKGAMGIILLNQLHLNDWTILSSITLVWAANIAVPSIIGSLLWIRKNHPPVKCSRS